MVAAGHAARASNSSLARLTQRKHAAAANVEIELAFSECGQVRLWVRDDGKGAPDGTMGTGFGLTGIRERAQQLNGTATYRTAPREGFTLSLELPG